MASVWRINEQRDALIRQHTALGRWGTATDLVGAYLLLASKASSAFVTGSTINVDGGYGDGGDHAVLDAGPYSASKAAIISITKCSALEYARDRIRVNCVCPGTFRSHIHDGLPDNAHDVMAARHPMGLGQAADLVGALAYLAGPDSAWTTGASHVVDGGYVAQ